MDARGHNGQFAKGNPGGLGRPKRETESNYLALLAAGVSQEDWLTIVTRAVESAKKGDARARDWLSRHLMGEQTTVDAEQETTSRIILMVPGNGRGPQGDSIAEPK